MFSLFSFLFCCYIQHTQISDIFIYFIFILLLYQIYFIITFYIFYLVDQLSQPLLSSIQSKCYVQTFDRLGNGRHCCSDSEGHVTRAPSSILSNSMVTIYTLHLPELIDEGTKQHLDFSNCQFSKQYAKERQKYRTSFHALKKEKSVVFFSQVLYHSIC